MKDNYQVWTCKIVVGGDPPLPMGFDSVPRRRAIMAIEEKGIPVISCFSGWGGNLKENEKNIVEGMKERKFVQECPVCGGTGLISIPPGTAGDRETFSTTSAGPWPCRACNGTGIVRRFEE